MKKRRVIDKREKAKFMVDDAFLEKMARLCGWQGTIVYASLCRHANKDQECFPSIGLMAAQHRVSRTTVLKGIRALEERCVIYVNKARSKGGKWLNNTYILLDKAEWDYQVHKVDMESSKNEAITESMSDTLPSPSGVPSQVHSGDTKEAHGKETHELKETHLLQNGVLQNGSFSGRALKDSLPLEKKRVDIFLCGEVESPTSAKLSEVIRLFEPILPGDFVGSRSALLNSTTREAVAALLQRKSVDQVAELIWRYYNAREDPYRPKVGKVYHFCTSRLADIEHHVMQETATHTVGDWDSSKKVTWELIKKDEEEHRRLTEEWQAFIENHK